MINLLSIKNFKSIGNQQIILRPLTVLVGPNAAGKSNILDCPAFVRDVVEAGLDKALEKRGEFRDLVWGGDISRPISISFSSGGKEETTAFDYSIKIEGPRPRITEEWGRTRTPAGPLVEFRRQDSKVLLENSERSIPSGSVSALTVVSEAVLLREAILGWSFYEFITSSMRRSQGVAKQTRLHADGSNVATVLHSIYSEEPEVFTRVEELLKAAIPEVDRLLSPLTVDGKTYVAWREKNVPSRIPAWNMSEGSVRLVAVLVALLVPEPPPLVAFETPEIHLHPYLMEYLADILKAGSQRSQVLATTHSPYLLNYIPLDSLLIVKKEQGESRVEPVEDTAHLRQALKELGLGEVYYAGHLGGVP